MNSGKRRLKAATEVDAEAMARDLAEGYDYRSAEDAGLMAEQLEAVGEARLARAVNLVLAPNTPEGWRAMFAPECDGDIYAWYTEVFLQGRWTVVDGDGEYLAYSPEDDDYRVVSAARLEDAWAEAINAVVEYFVSREADGDDPDEDVLVLPEVEANVAYGDYAPV